MNLLFILYEFIFIYMNYLPTENIYIKIHYV